MRQQTLISLILLFGATAFAGEPPPVKTTVPAFGPKDVPPGKSDQPAVKAPDESLSVMGVTVTAPGSAPGDLKMRQLISEDGGITWRSFGSYSCGRPPWKTREGKPTNECPGGNFEGGQGGQPQQLPPGTMMKTEVEAEKTSNIGIDYHFYKKGK